MTLPLRRAGSRVVSIPAAAVAWSRASTEKNFNIGEPWKPARAGHGKNYNIGTPRDRCRRDAHTRTRIRSS